MEGFYFCWLELHERRTYNEFAPNPITFSDIKVYQELMQEDLSPYGVEVICSIDRLYLKSLNDSKGT